MTTQTAQLQTSTLVNDRFAPYSNIWTIPLSNVEISDDYKRAILTIPLFHIGPNKKGLYWTEEMLKEIAPLYQNIPFRYDLDGKEGSSHTLQKLSSPHFDVGWTYNGEEGAWYDNKTKSLWVKGEITHPQVIEKLQRQTSDGKREVNYASMGIVVEEAKCSICGSEYGSCEHERNIKYLEGTAYKVPTKCSKGLHVALTNDPADGEAEIAKCIFQELGDDKMLGQDYREQTGSQNTSTNLSNQTPGGLAVSSPQTAQPGMAPSPQDILKDLAERIKTIEMQISQPTPELVNAAPQDQMMQSNMGTTTQFDQTKGQMNTEDKEAGKMDVKDGQAKQDQTPVNPVKSEVQELGNPMDNIMAMLQQILQKLNGGNEVQDAADLTNAGKEKMQHVEDKPTEHMAPGESISKEASQDESNKKNKQHMMEPGKVATADTEEESEEEDIKQEVADLKAQVKSLKGKLELQDQEIPEFGGSSAKGLEIADMNALQRRESFGEYGSWDAIFNGAKSAQKFKR